MNNFLSIVWYRIMPADYGGQKGIAEFNDWLGRKIPLTCLCSRNNTPGNGLSYKVLPELPVSRFQFLNPFARKQILSLIRKQSFSHIIIEHPYHAWLGKYKKKAGFLFIVHAHNIEHLRMKARAKPWWPLIKMIERKAFHAADYILFKTDADKQQAISLFNIDPAKCIIVPFGIKESGQPVVSTVVKDAFRKKYSIAPDEKVIVFAGTLTYEPNAEAIENISQHIIPLLQKKGFAFRLFICGAIPAKKLAELNSIPGITATGFVPSLQEYLQAADIFINPVTSGSGIQTKNIEAIANGCTVVSTGFAARGLPGYLLNEKVLVSADHDWEAFTINIIKAAALTGKVPEIFYEDYNWQHTIERLLPQIAVEAGKTVRR
jgi:glycosyltransferase involved in cell wall biosynthesis